MSWFHKSEVWDYIIIGSGCAGSLLARRLSDNFCTSVLLLENGTDYQTNREEILNPLEANNLEADLPQYFYEDTQSVPQKELSNRTFHIGAGKVVGGGSSINGLQYVQGSRDWFEEWEKHAGPNWSPGAISQAFKEMESFLTPFSITHSRGTDGPIPIVATRALEGTEMIADAASKALGIPIIADYNETNNNIGAFQCWQLYSFLNGTRASSDRIFLRDVINDTFQGKHGRQLTVVLNALVDRILIENHCAKGVIYRKSTGEEVRAMGHTIISCAGVHSPTILLRSGIGPAKTLSKLGIPIVEDLQNVGRNFQNQLIVTVTLSGPAIPGSDSFPQPYLGGAFWSDATDAQPRRAFQGIGMALPAPTTPSASTPGMTMAGQSTPNFALIGIQLSPKSSGYITIKDTDPQSIPLFNWRYLTNEADLISLMQLTRDLVKWAQALPGYTIVSPTSADLASDDSLKAWIKQNCDETHHGLGSCRMGLDPTISVVDPNCKVWNMKNLYVVDCSALPREPLGNPSASVYVMAWKISQHLSRHSWFKICFG